MRVKLLISYDGTDYFGWQKQPHQPSIQETLEKAVSQMLNQETSVIGASRTDAGVHAFGQIAHFDTQRKAQELENLPYRLQGLLPANIVIKSAWSAPDSFEASFSATHKTYRYFVYNQPRPSAIQARFTHWVRKPLDLKLLNAYCEIIKGNQDFASFANAGGAAQTTVREILAAEFTRKGQNVVFEITGRGFLKQMVRNLIGTFLDLEMRKNDPKVLQNILFGRSRQLAKATAPANALFLKRVYYPPSLDNKCRRL